MWTLIRFRPAVVTINHPGQGRLQGVEPESAAIDFDVTINHPGQGRPQEILVSTNSAH